MALGLTQHFLAQLDEHELSAVVQQCSSTPSESPISIGRVAFVSRDRVRLLHPRHPEHPLPLVAGSLFDPQDPVLVGDWVVVRDDHDPPLVLRRLERSTVIRRKSPSGGVQAVSANIDTALLCTAHGGDLNVRRMERWLAIAAEAGITPVVVLTKADDGVDLDADLDALSALGEVEIIPVSALDGRGMAALRARLPPGRTAALLGSSGVGKSTLLNALLGEDRQDTGEIRRSDERGKHTTTTRTLHLLPSGALLVDNPGVREVGLLAPEGVGAAFPEVEALLGRCRFRDCGHTEEPGCAVLDAIDSGTLSEARWLAWGKLQREAAREARRLDKRAQSEAQKSWKRVTQANRARLRAAGWQKGQGR